MKDPYLEVFEEIGLALSKQSEMILELAKTCLTVKQYEEFGKTVEQKINIKKRDTIDSLIKEQ